VRISKALYLIYLYLTVKNLLAKFSVLLRISFVNFIIFLDCGIEFPFFFYSVGTVAHRLNEKVRYLFLIQALHAYCISITLQKNVETLSFCYFNVLNYVMCGSIATCFGLVFSMHNKQSKCIFFWFWNLVGYKKNVCRCVKMREW